MSTRDYQNFLDRYKKDYRKRVNAFATDPDFIDEDYLGETLDPTNPQRRAFSEKGKDFVDSESNRYLSKYFTKPNDIVLEDDVNQDKNPFSYKQNRESQVGDKFLDKPVDDEAPMENLLNQEDNSSWSWGNITNKLLGRGSSGYSHIPSEVEEASPFPRTFTNPFTEGAQGASGVKNIGRIGRVAQAGAVEAAGVGAAAEGAGVASSVLGGLGSLVTPGSLIPLALMGYSAYSQYDQSKKYEEEKRKAQGEQNKYSQFQKRSAF